MRCSLFVEIVREEFFSSVRAISMKSPTASCQQMGNNSISGREKSDVFCQTLPSSDWIIIAVDAVNTVEVRCVSVSVSRASFPEHNVLPMDVPSAAASAAAAVVVQHFAGN